MNNLIEPWSKGFRLIDSICKERTGMTYQKLSVLKVVKRRMKVSDISNALDLNTSSISTLLKRMESVGLINRFHGELDRRTVFVEISKKGKQLLAEHKSELDNLESVLEGIFTEDLLNKMNTATDNLKRLLRKDLN